MSIKQIMKNLFKSQTAYEILELLSNQEDGRFYLNEIASALKKNSANVSRELNGLIAEKIVSSITVGKKKYYFLNSQYDALPELKSLLMKNNNQSLDQRFKGDWLLAEEIINANPWFMAICFYCFANQFVSPGGRAYKRLAAIYKGYHLWFYFDKQDAYEIGEHLVDKFVASVGFMEEVNDKIRYFADTLVKVVSKIPEGNLRKLNNDDLWRHYQDHEDIHREYYQWGWIPAAADMFGDNLTNRGKEILTRQGVSADKVEEYLALLTQPDKASMLKEEQDNLIKIGIKVQSDQEQFSLLQELFRKFKEEDVKFFGLYTHSEKYEQKFTEVVRSLKNKIRPDILADLEHHYRQYFYTKFLYTEEQGVYDFEHYLKSLVRLVNSDHNLQATAQKQAEESRNLLKKRQELIKQLSLKPDLVRFFSAWGDFMITKIYRRYAQLFALYKTTYILEEMAARVGLSLKELRFMRTEEIRSALFKKIIDKEEIKSRVKLAVYYTAANMEVYYSGAVAKDIVNRYFSHNSDQDLTELKGQCGCRGQAKGAVKIVNVMSDMAKMNKGDVLVSISTQPDLLPAMRKASAFVTDQGGVTSHAAIVAREMNTPCVIATKVATQVLHDGDIVEVDADKGIVKIIKKYAK